MNCFHSVIFPAEIFNYLDRSVRVKDRREGNIVSSNDKPRDKLWRFVCYSGKLSQTVSKSRWKRDERGKETAVK